MNRNLGLITIVLWLLIVFPVGAYHFEYNFTGDMGFNGSEGMLSTSGSSEAIAHVKWQVVGHYWDSEMQREMAVIEDTYQSGSPPALSGEMKFTIIPDTGESSDTPVDVTITGDYAFLIETLSEGSAFGFDFISGGMINASLGGPFDQSIMVSMSEGDQSGSFDDVIQLQPNMEYSVMFYLSAVAWVNQPGYPPNSFSSLEEFEAYFAEETGFERKTTSTASLAFSIGIGDHPPPENPMVDLDGNGQIDIKDVINAIQIVLGKGDLTVPLENADISGDKKIGLEEVIYALQVAAKMREPVFCYYRDADGDGYGDPNKSIHSLVKLEGYVADNTDCDDTSAAVYPGATEIPDDGIVQNCEIAGPYDMETYFPLTVGNSWLYNDGQMEIISKNGNTFIAQDTGACEEGGHLQWQNDLDGLKLLGVSSLTFSAPIKYANKNAEVGDEITSVFTIPGVGLTGNALVRFVGIEDVTVPAGTFKNCVKLSQEVSPNEPDGSYHKTYLWFAEGVGIVKMNRYDYQPPESYGCILSKGERNLISFDLNPPALPEDP